MIKSWLAARGCDLNRFLEPASQAKLLHSDTPISLFSAYVLVKYNAGGANQSLLGEEAPPDRLFRGCAGALSLGDGRGQPLALSSRFLERWRRGLGLLHMLGTL